MEEQTYELPPYTKYNEVQPTQAHAPYPPAQAPYPPAQASYPPTAPNPGFYYPQPPAAPHPIQQYAPPPQPTTIIMAAPAPAPTTNIVVNAGGGRTGPGNCPACRRGNIRRHFTCCGILWAIFCFPIGFICCCCCQEKRCSSCGAHYG